MTGRAAAIAIDPFSDAFLANPYRFHGALRDAGSVVWLERYGIYAMARHAEVSAALKDHETSCSRRGVGLADFALEAPWRAPSLLLETDPPVHDRIRSLVGRVIGRSALLALRPEWAREAEALVDALVARGTFDGVKDLGEVYPLRVFPDAVGLPREGGENLLPYGTMVFNAFGPRNALTESTMAAAAPVLHWVANACKRKALAPDGFGAAVFAQVDAGKASEEDGERLVRSFLAAGVDTTINGIGNMLHAFATNPDQWQALREDQSLLPLAFEEVLRFDSTVQTFFRTTTCDVAVDGTTIPEGSKVLLFLAAANRDPRKWDDADRFDLRRSAIGHVGFGLGIHGCVGQMVARQEAELVLRALIARVVTIELTGPPVRRLNDTLH